VGDAASNAHARERDFEWMRKVEEGGRREESRRVLSCVVPAFHQNTAHLGVSLHFLSWEFIVRSFIQHRDTLSEDVDRGECTATSRERCCYKAELHRQSRAAAEAQIREGAEMARRGAGGRYVAR